MIHIIQRLRAASGSNRKLTILRKEADNEAWKKVLVAMYDDSINYGVSAPHDFTFIEEPIDVDQLLSHLSLLSSRVYTGNDARAHALDGSETFGEVYRLILSGSLKAGVSVTSINKCYPGLIPTFEVMLAQDAEIHTYPCVVSTKYDGVRLVAFVVKPESGTSYVTLKLRSGKPIHIESLEFEMSKQPPGVYDGELVAGDGLQEGRTKITGSVNKCLKGTATDIDDYTFCIFDKISNDNWAKQECIIPYITRIDELNKVEQSSKVRLADMFVAGSPEVVEEYYADRLARGYEGVIARYLQDPYVWGRTHALIKKKATKECVLTCVDTTEGTGKYAGLTGALVCEGKIGQLLVRVKLGSGLTDHDRELPPSHFVGQDIEVLYNDIVRAKDAMHYSLFLPRYKRIHKRMDT